MKKWRLYFLGCFLTLAFLGNALAEVAKKSEGEALGWVEDPTTSNLCRGYFVEPGSQFSQHLPKQDFYIHADQAVLSLDNTSTYSGHVVVAQPTQNIQADHATTTLNKQKNGLKTIHASGNVKIHQPGMLAIAERGEADIPDQTATLYNTIYRLLRTNAPLNPTSQAAYRLSGLSAHGHAEVTKQTAPQQYYLENADYTTCAPGTHSWSLHAKNIHIDDAKKKVKMKHTFLKIFSLPVLYTPYLSFSYDNTPTSGLLLPVTGYTTRGGLQFGVPYYWYIAPNYQATITPTYFGRRNMRLETDFNYLTWNSRGNVYFSVLPNDSAFANFKATAPTHFPGNPGLNRLRNTPTSRGYFAWQNQTIFDSNWSSATNLHYVTDDYYFQDLGGGLANQAGFNQLVQQSTLQYHAEHWTFTGLVQNYQTLHPVNTAPFVDQFSRFPQLNLGTSYPDVFGHLDLGNQISYTNFRQPMITNHFDTNLPLRTVGQRLNVAPTLSVPNYAPWGYIAPRLQLDGTVYRLSDLEHNIPRDIHRGIPIFNIDTGLYFDRHTHLGTKDFTQTFEPRLFYLWAPTVPQGNIPLFDTAEPLFSYDMLFQTNRFNGIDRISNANQVGVGLTNRLINSATGNDLLTASIGQIYYFTDRKVYLTTGTRNDDQKISPIAGLLNYQITPALNITGNGAWNPTFHYFQNSALNLGYKRDPKHILNVGFTYQRYNALDPGFIPINRNNDIQQLATSGAWPISTKWSAIAALTYNLNNRYAQNYLTGLQYDTCCWALRIVSAHNFLFLNQQNTPIYDTSYYVEWVLKGLTNVSMNSPTSLLVNSVPGYTNTIENY